MLLAQRDAPWTVVFALIVSWYITSISLHLYNKWLFAASLSNFHFPIFTTMIHMIIQGLLSYLVLHTMMPALKPQKYEFSADYVYRVVPCGIATALDIGLSNSSIKYITLSFYTMVKSAAPVFVLLFAFLFGLEKFSFKLTLSIIIICLGVAVMVANETHFNLTGYLQAQAATVISGFRWSLTQILLQSSAMGINNPLATNLFLAPVVAVSLCIAFLIEEGPFALFSDPHLSNFGMALFIFLTITGGGCLAFLMVNIEFQLIYSTNVVTFSVAGIFKEIFTILAAVLVFGDQMTGKGELGLFISLIGIAGKFQSKQAYNYHRNQQRLAKLREEYEELDLSEFANDHFDSSEEELEFDPSELDSLTLDAAWEKQD